MQKNSNFQLGLLHFVHFLVKVDGRIDERERLAIIKIRKEENISDSVFKDFEKSVLSRSEQEIYSRGAELLNTCTEEEKICAFVHLYRLAQADSILSTKEARFLMYGLELTNIDLDEVILKANLTEAKSA
ncbi:MAG: hypothetical protein JJE09_11870 [Bacteroidia bacterium]|nr:hypothetical protein [Bacteroidia bacterium]